MILIVPTTVYHPSISLSSLFVRSSSCRSETKRAMRLVALQQMQQQRALLATAATSKSPSPPHLACSVRRQLQSSSPPRPFLSSSAPRRSFSAVRAEAGGEALSSAEAPRDDDVSVLFFDWTDIFSFQLMKKKKNSKTRPDPHQKKKKKLRTGPPRLPQRRPRPGRSRHRRRPRLRRPRRARPRRAAPPGPVGPGLGRRLRRGGRPAALLEADSQVRGGARGVVPTGDQGQGAVP